MIRNTKIIIYSILLMSILGCTEQYEYTDKKNLNNILNSFSKGEFYSCNLKPSTDQRKNYKANKDISLIQSENKIGLIYKSDKWNNGNSIYIEDNIIKNSFNMGSFYSTKDFSEEIINNEVKLKFDKKNLKVSLYDKNVINTYTCIELKKILSEAMKKQMLKNFILQKNIDRQ